MLYGNIPVAFSIYVSGPEQLLLYPRQRVSKLISINLPTVLYQRRVLIKTRSRTDHNICSSSSSKTFAEVSQCEPRAIYCGSPVGLQRRQQGAGKHGRTFARSTTGATSPRRFPLQQLT